MVVIFLWIALSLMGVYVLLCLFLAIWYKKQDVAPSFSGNHRNPVSFSVIIPFRNEAERLHGLVQSILNTDKPEVPLEFLWMNDHSEDGGEEQLAEMLRDFPFSYRILDLADKEMGKKAALQHGIAAASYDFVLFLDADVYPAHPSFFKAWSRAFAEKQASLLSSRIYFRNKGKFFHSLAEVEQQIIFLVAKVLSRMNGNQLCQGGNLGLEKKVFFEVNGYEGNRHIASGDDVFLMEKVRKREAGKIAFLESGETEAWTDYPESISGFLGQRARWAGKWSAMNAWNKGIMVLIGLSNGMVLFLIGICFLFPAEWKWGVGLISVKFFLDIFLLYLATDNDRFKKTRKIAWIICPVYPFYVTLVILFALFLPVQWKGRKI